MPCQPGKTGTQLETNDQSYLQSLWRIVLSPFQGQDVGSLGSWVYAIAFQREEARANLQKTSYLQPRAVGIGKIVEDTYRLDIFRFGICLELEEHDVSQTHGF